MSIDQASSMAPEAEPLAPKTVSRPDYDGRAGDLAKIAISNALLTLTTLGIYRFWGKTRIRRYVWSHVSFLGDRLEYSGRPVELLVGFIVAIGILAPIFGAFHFMEIWAGIDELALVLVSLIELVIIFFLIHLAIYRARRYRLTRTQWRGIRGGQTGSAFTYAFLALGWTFVMIITLGLAYPLYRIRLQRYAMEHTWFGDRSCSFEGRAAKLFGPWLLTWILYLPTLGFVFFWYKAREFRYLVSETRFGALSFRSELSGVSLFVVYFFYSMALTLTIGLVVTFATKLMPEVFQTYMSLAEGDTATVMASDPVIGLTLVAVMAMTVVSFGVIQVLFFLHPLIRVLCQTMSVLGEEDYAAIAQNQETMPSRGEGLADTLDLGAI